MRRSLESIQALAPTESGRINISIQSCPELEPATRSNGADTSPSSYHNQSYEGPSPIPSSSSILDLTFGQKLAVASGHFINDITASIWFSYFLIYAEEVVGLSGQSAAILMLIGQVRPLVL
jgi:hypothetical protein